jgi:hypothetical protein
MDLLTIAAWASIGQFIIGIVALIVELRRGSLGRPAEAQARLSRILRIAAAVIIGGLTIAVPGSVMCWVSLLLATYAPGTATTLIVRSIVWATSLAMTWGIVWSFFLLPLLVRLVRQRKGGTQ